jgi:hypothetical protein
MCIGHLLEYEMPYSPTDLLKSESKNLGVDFVTPFCFENPLHQSWQGQ